MISSYGTVLFQKTIGVLVSQKIENKEPFIESIISAETVDMDILKVYEHAIGLIDPVLSEKFFLLALTLTSRHYPADVAMATKYLDAISQYPRLLKNLDDYELYNKVFFELVTKADPNATEMTKHAIPLATLATKTPKHAADALKLAYVEYPDKIETLYAGAMAIQNLDLNPAGGLESDLKAIMQHLTNADELITDIKKFLQLESKVEVALMFILALLEKVDNETKIAILKKLAPELPFKFSSCSKRSLNYIGRILNLMPVPEQYDETDKFNVAVQLSFAAPNLSNAITSFEDALSSMLVQFTEKRKDAPTFETVVQELNPYGVILYAINFGIFETYPDVVKKAFDTCPLFTIEALRFIITNKAVTQERIPLIGEAFFNAVQTDIVKKQETLDQCVQIIKDLGEFHADLLKLFFERCAYITHPILVREFCKFFLSKDLSATETFPTETVAHLARFLILDDEDTETVVAVAKFLGVICGLETIPTPTTANDIAPFYCPEDERMQAFQAFLIKQAKERPNTGYEVLAAGTFKLSDANAKILTKNVETSYANYKLYTQYFQALARNNTTQAVDQLKIAFNDVVPLPIQFTKPPPPKEFYEAAFPTIIWIVQNAIKDERDMKNLYAVTKIAVPGPAMADQVSETVIKALKILVVYDKLPMPDNLVKKVLDSSFPEFIPTLFSVIGKDRIDDAIITIIQHAMTKPFGYDYNEQLQSILTAGKNDKTFERFFARFAKLADKKDCTKLLELMSEVSKVARGVGCSFTSTKDDHDFLEILVPYTLHIDEKSRNYALNILKNVYEVGCGVDTIGLAHSEITTIVHTLWCEVVKKVDKAAIARLFKFCVKIIEKSEAASIVCAAIVDRCSDCCEDKDFDELFLIDEDTLMFHNVYESLKRYTEENKRVIAGKLFTIGYRPMTLALFSATIQDPDFVKAIFIEGTAQPNHDKFVEILAAFHETTLFDPVIFLIVLSFYSVQKQNRRKVKGLTALMAQVISQEIIKSTIINPQNLSIDDDLHIALKDISLKAYNLSVAQLKAIADNAEVYCKSGEDFTSLTFGTLFAILAAQFAVLKTNQDLCLQFYKLFIMAIQNATNKTAGFILASFNDVVQEHIIEKIPQEFLQVICQRSAEALTETALSDKHVNDCMALMCCVYAKYDEKAELAPKIFEALDFASAKVITSKEIQFHMMETLLTVAKLQTVKFAEKGIAKPAALLQKCFHERKDIGALAFEVLKQITGKEEVDDVVVATCQAIDQLPNVGTQCATSCSVPMMSILSLSILDSMAKYMTCMYSKAEGFYANLYPVAFKVIEESDDLELVMKASELIKKYN